MNEREMSEVFGDPISTYTREQALEDGVLVDVSELDGAKLYKHPVAITQSLHFALCKGVGKHASDYAARVWDVCYMATLPAQRDGIQPGDSDVFFKCIVGSETLNLWANCGPADDGSPCITIGFPEDR